MASAKRMNASWLSMAPLGIAVVPEVYMITAVSLTRTACWRWRTSSALDERGADLRTGGATELTGDEETQRLMSRVEALPELRV